MWIWDITFLACSLEVGQFFYLYAILDLWSRNIAGLGSARAVGERAAEFVEKAAWRERLRRRPLILHADNGGCSSW